MGLRVEERIVAGAEGDDIVVHHLVLRGSTGAISRHLCELVRARYGVHAPAEVEAVPCLREQLRCSAAFVPPRQAASGHPLVARTFEAAGPLGHPRPGEPPTAGRPYVIELHPDEGHPSLAVCAFDLEGAALDGVNAEGLVAVAAPELAFEPGRWRQALHVVRRLLDRCATAAEARAALAELALDEAALPARWLVADRRGDAFVLELSPGAGPRCVEAAGGRLELASRGANAPHRTLWHGEYDPVERRLSARFFVGAGDWRRGVPEIAFQLS
jgi:hypothetical protein